MSNKDSHCPHNMHCSEYCTLSNSLLVKPFQFLSIFHYILFHFFKQEYCCLNLHVEYSCNVTRGFCKLHRGPTLVYTSDAVSKMRKTCKRCEELTSCKLSLSPSILRNCTFLAFWLKLWKWALWWPSSSVCLGKVHTTSEGGVCLAGWREAWTEAARRKQIWTSPGSWFQWEHMDCEKPQKNSRNTKKNQSEWSRKNSRTSMESILRKYLTAIMIPNRFFCGQAKLIIFY